MTMGQFDDRRSMQAWRDRKRRCDCAERIEHVLAGFERRQAEAQSHYEIPGLAKWEPGRGQEPKE